MELHFKNAFMYPFRRPVGLLNILWILLPVLGLFSIMGYGIRIIREFVEGKFEELPKMHFADDLELGFVMFIKLIPFLIGFWLTLIVSATISIQLYYLVYFFVSLFVMPMLLMNFYYKGTVASSFEFSKVHMVFSHFADYLIMFLKTILLGLIFIIMMIVLVGFPAQLFTQYIFIADFYRRHNPELKEKRLVKKDAASASTKKRKVVKKSSKKKATTTKRNIKKNTSKK